MPIAENGFEKIFLVSKIFFVFPLKKGKNGFQFCRWITTFSIIHLVLLICGVVYQIHVTPQIFERDALGKSLYYLMQIIRVVEIMFFVVHPIISLDRMNKIFRELKSIDSQLSDFFTTFDNPKICKISCFYVCMDITMVIFDVYCYRDGLFDTFFFYWTILIIHILGIEMLGFMELFLVRFAALSHLIKGLTHRKSHSLTRVIKLSKINRSLLDCYLETSEFLSVPLLAYTYSCFVQLAVESYSLLLISSDQFDFRSVAEYLVQIFVVVSAFGNFYVIANRAQNTSTKAKEFKTLLYQLIQRDATSVLSNDKTLQLNIAWRKEAEFNICGLFNLNLALVQSMLGAVTTYFVMILQFSEKSRSQEL